MKVVISIQLLEVWGHESCCNLQSTCTPLTILEPLCEEKYNNLGFRSGPTQNGLYSQRKEPEA